MADDSNESSETKNTDTHATRQKTRGALLGGLRSGALEQAVAKMEADEESQVGEDATEAAAAVPAISPEQKAAEAAEHARKKAEEAQKLRQRAAVLQAEATERKRAANKTAVDAATRAEVADVAEVRAYLREAFLAGALPTHDSRRQHNRPTPWRPVR